MGPDPVAEFYHGSESRALKTSELDPDGEGETPGKERSEAEETIENVKVKTKK